MTATASDLSPALAHRQALREFSTAHYDRLCQSRQRNAYFHRYLARIVSHHVLPGSRILDVGCAGGDMLAALQPAAGGGFGIDINPAAIADARTRHPDLTFHECPAEDIPTTLLALEPTLRASHSAFRIQNSEFAPGVDYVLLSGVLPQLYDLHTALEAIRPVCHDRTRLIVCTFSGLWHPVIRCGEFLGHKCRVPDESWMPPAEVENLLTQCDYAAIRQVHGILLPLGIPLVANLINRYLAPLPVLNHLSLCTITIARPVPNQGSEVGIQDSPPSVSIIVPARNESGNIRPLLQRLPQLAPKQEVIFVEGHSTDDTWEVIQQAVAEYNWESGIGNRESAPSTAAPMPDARCPMPGLALSCLQQAGKGKGDAVRAGFDHATGDILLILDADLSVMPEELPRFIEVLVRGHCEFANGSRLVYPMDRQAMRFLNMLANKLFGWTFTFLLGQHLRDTLCGTKALRRADYLRLAAQRAYFGDFDPFGDFDLLFGAARLNLKIQDVPVHYKQRSYGATNISRFRHGVMLLRMCGFAARKIKFV